MTDQTLATQTVLRHAPVCFVVRQGQGDSRAVQKIKPIESDRFTKPSSAPLIAMEWNPCVISRNMY